MPHTNVSAIVLHDWGLRAFQHITMLPLDEQSALKAMHT
jgi:hypothetical protein